ncbi:MAG: divergent polysaccharide deacetylase family protein, partial [Desulfobacterales bacterium]
VGVNNHMGSRFTSSRREIQIALQTIKREGLFFIDSLTSNRSCAYLTARHINMATGRRNAFLDNTRHPANIIQRLYHLVDHALLTGAAIGIGHPFPETAIGIRQFCSEIQGTGVHIVPVSEVLAHTESVHL